MSSLEKLRSDAKRGKWSEIFETYKNESAFRTKKITTTEDTLLHMAVSNRQEKVVEKMVDLLVDEKRKRSQNNVVVTVEGGGEVSWNMNVVLGAENDRKNTPLHLAAIRGNVKMCKKIGGKDPSLIARRNIMGETPLLLAVLSGNKEAFLCLHDLYVRNYGASSAGFAHCVRDNDDTILHCAIAQEHIDVAIEIVRLYNDHMQEMMRRNKNGLSPLHLLASKRSAFKSTGLLEVPTLLRPIYWLPIVKKKKHATVFEELSREENEESFLSMFIKIISFLLLIPLLLLLRPASTFSEAVFERRLYDIREMKQKHTWWHQIMTELLQHASDEDMSKIIRRKPSEQLSMSLQTKEDNEWESMETPTSGTIIIETPLMIAVKNGVVEMVEKILELFPSRIKDVNAEGKNILLLAAEYRQTEVFMFLCKQEWLKESDVFRKMDKEGNNALHLAARLGIEPDWLNPGEALSMPREIKWFEFVKRRMPYDLLERYNRKMETPEDILRESHKQLMKSEAEWVVKTSQACSVVSTLVASVAFTTSTNAPGGYDDNGYAILRNMSIFKNFTGSSFGAFFFSLISTVCFLSVVASPSQSVHSWRYVPVKLYIGTSFMFVSIICLWISFCAGHFFTIDDERRKLHKSVPIYIFLSLEIIVFVATLLRTFLGPLLSSFSRIPTPRRKAIRPIEYRKD